MIMTIFEEAEARGEIRTGQKMLLLALRKKFKKIPKRIETAIHQISDINALESLISDLIDSQTLKEFEKALQ